MKPARASQQAQVARLVKAFEPRIQAAFLAAVQTHAQSINMGALIAALEAGDVSRAVQLLTLPQGLLFPLDDAIRGAYVSGGGLASAPVAIGVFAFDGRNPRAEAWLRAHGGALIQNIQSDTLDMVRTVITAGLSENIGARKIATDIVGRTVGGKRVGGFLGLTDQVAASITRARGLLTAGDFDAYKDLKLRDRRFDGLLSRVAAGKETLTATDIDRILAAHKSKALGYRGKVIAQDQTFTAVSTGRDEGYRQILDRPDVDGVTIRWQHNLSENPRQDHVDMNGTVIRMGEVFQMPDGARLKYPHDPEGGAKHNLGCRCVGIYRVVVGRD